MAKGQLAGRVESPVPLPRGWGASAGGQVRRGGRRREGEGRAGVLRTRGNVAKAALHTLINLYIKLASSDAQEEVVGRGRSLERGA